jgi:hypothetical protein
MRMCKRAASCLPLFPLHMHVSDTNSLVPELVLPMYNFFLHEYPPYGVYNL